jgi:formylglycine-generating enzyme required for sulfatase activity
MKKANPWGLSDMIGNVWQRCGDYYGNYPSEAVADPLAPAAGVDRVCRGGSWNYDAADCRAANRGGYGPGFRDGRLGFRPALDSLKLKISSSQVKFFRRRFAA